MPKQTIINVVSGKGGTGKTLFSAILAEMLGNKGVPILVVDMDIFVRGLTALLYFQRGESLLITEEDDLAVADLFISKQKTLSYGFLGHLGIYRYRSFDVSPSVHRIDEILNFRDVSPDNYDEALAILEKMLELISERFKYIILDSRAGFDELIAATHKISTLSLCVQEEDAISNVTADSLTKQLEVDSRKPVFRIINKARNIKDADDLDQPHMSRFNYLGAIPFDMDVMNSFGQKTFWEDISKSIYKAAVVRIWNKLSNRMSLGDELPELRVSPLGSERLEKRLGKYSLYNRVLIIYGLLMGFLGIGVSLIGRDTIESLSRDPLKLASITISFSGFLLALWGFFRNQPRD